MKARALGVRFWGFVYIISTGLTALTGCSTGGTPGGTVDGGVVADADPPAADARPDASTGGGFGDPCQNTLDCAPNTVCYEDTCTNFCTGDCPPGYECKTVQIGGSTVEATICVPAQETFCHPCQTNSDCGDTSDLCIELTAGRFCSIDCKDQPSICPHGFNCVNLGNVGDGNAWQCMPLNGVCCVDLDGDLRGVGGGCPAGDCDETNPAVYDDATEICDGFDNNCIGGVDVDPHDCAAAACNEGAGGYFERPGDVCSGVGGCVQQPSVQCGLYTCDGGGEQGDHCALACDVEQDGKCVPSAHCDASVCKLDLANGQGSDEDSDCISNHSQNGFCCGSGDCCAVSQDCPTFGISAPICEDTATCQGSRGQAICSNNECGAQDGVPDDSACDATVIANECGLYRPIHCTGAHNQTPPTCPSSCASNDDCDANAYCDPVSDTCKPDLDNGQACPQGNPSCESGHCQNGFCCNGGDCCATEASCPASYTTAPTCDTPSACQGTADVAQCVSFSCVTSFNVPDDSACVSSIVANPCGPYLPIHCSGSHDQDPPECPTSCTSSSQCDANAYCSSAGACVPDEPNGGTCSEAGGCQSDHCQNGFCCDSGDCCADSNDCNAYDVSAVCNSQTTCQGARVDGSCSASFQCSGVTVDDDAACAGLQSNDCGPFPAVQCTAMQNQPPNQGGLCAVMCLDDSQCDASAHCSGGLCVPDQGPGGFCTGTNECGSGLQCVDSVCCSSSCTGSCEACDVPGHEGTCFAVPNGEDPDGECPGVSCTGFFAGWSGDSCFRKADVSAAAATCGGNRACHTAAQECSAQATVGPVALTCDDNCQDPNLATCSGISAGVCNNVNPGSQTCGQGICQRTVAQCQNGGDNVCVPGTPTGESCNDLDDNCDGIVDNSSAFEDSPDSTGCGNLTTFPEIPSDGTITQTRKLYPSGDQDFFKVHLHETDSSCGCGFSFDEDYLITVVLTVPVGAGSYQVCRGVNDCSDQQCTTVTAGSSGQIQWFQDGACGIGAQDDYDLYLHVKGVNSPGFECQPYQLDITFDAGQCN